MAGDSRRNDEAEDIIAAVERKIIEPNATGIVDPGYNKASPTRFPNSHAHTLA